MSSGGRRLSIIRELGVLASSVGFVRAVVAQKLDGSSHGEIITELVVMAGALRDLQDRIALLGKVLRGTANPAQLLSPSNEEEPSRSGPFILSEWSAEEQVRRTLLAVQAGCYRRALERLPTKKTEKEGSN